MNAWPANVTFLDQTVDARESYGDDEEYDFLIIYIVEMQ
jgi:hypothetical protein